MDFNTGTRSGDRYRRPGAGGFDRSDPLRSFLSTLPRVLFSPRTFFRDISYRRGFANPLIFAVVCALIGAVLKAVFNGFMQSVFPIEPPAAQPGLLTVAITAFIDTMIALAISAGIYHLLVRLIVGADNAGLGGTFRVVCYAAAVQVLGFLPFLNILAALYGLYLCAFGFQEVHSTTYQRAATIAALPILLLIIAALAFGILAASLLSAV